MRPSPRKKGRKEERKKRKGGKKEEKRKKKEKSLKTSITEINKTHQMKNKIIK